MSVTGAITCFRSAVSSCGSTTTGVAKLLSSRCVIISQKCFLRDVDYFGFKISKKHLGETMKDHKVFPTIGYSNLKTRSHRMIQKSPENVDLAKFASTTLTERAFSVKLPDRYTIEPLRKYQSGGRDPNTGRIAIHHRGGGIKKWMHWVDFNRLGPSENDDLEEKVLWVGRDLCRTGFIALVANGETKRYILAHHGMKVGDVIKSTRRIPPLFEPLKEGNAYPLGAMPEGTTICQLELYPRSGATKCRAAGACATVSTHLENDFVLVKLCDRRQVIVSKHCLAVVGKVARPEQREFVLSGARKRWMGIRPKSGWKTKKTGRFGRNLNKKQFKLIYDPDKPKPKNYVAPPLACRR